MSLTVSVALREGKGWGKQAGFRGSEDAAGAKPSTCMGLMLPRPQGGLGRLVSAPQNPAEAWSVPPRVVGAPGPSVPTITAHSSLRLSSSALSVSYSEPLGWNF